LDAKPEVVFEKLQKTMKPYSLKTTFIRLGEYYQWLMENGKKKPGLNPWKLFMKTHANLFKYVYQPEELEVTFDEARERILAIGNEDLRAAALQLLEGGLRSCELQTFDGKTVIGKGGKPREVYLDEQIATFRFTGTYSQLQYALKQVGLKPHTLRKLCFTEFSRLDGVTDIDIMKAGGWNTIETSAKYRQAQKRDVINSLFKKVRGG
jgi:integrase